MKKDFVVLARIEEIRTDLFFVMVSGVPEGAMKAESAVLKTGSAASKLLAESLRDRLMHEVRVEIESHGNRVVDQFKDV